MSTSFLLDTCVVQRYLDPRTQQQWPHVQECVDCAVAESGGLYISAITAFEIRRGLEVLARKGEGRRKLRMAELFLRNAMILELGGRGGAPWRVAIGLFAGGQVLKPAINIADADLLIAATAIAHERILVTADRRLHENLKGLGYARWTRLLTPA
jgi:predicted nucleic acid-binding protein